MNFTNTATLFLGSLLHPVDQSYCSFGRISSELQFEAEADVPNLSEDTEWDDSGIDRFLSRRSEQITLSEQCVEEQRNFTESEQKEIDALRETLEMKGCEMATYSNPPPYTANITIDNSNCSDEVTRYRAVCDADDSFQLVEWRAFKSICTGFAPVDNTGALKEIIFNMHFQNATSCNPKSCPNGNDWTAADIEFILEQDILTCDCGYVNASCALEYLDDSDKGKKTKKGKKNDKKDKKKK